MSRYDTEFHGSGPSTDQLRRQHRRSLPAGEIDFIFMYAAHDAFSRDLDRLALAAGSGQAADAAVLAGWATFKNQLHVHHTAEDIALWPVLRRRVTTPREIAVLDLMEAEHAQIDPLLSRVDALLSGETDRTDGATSLSKNTDALIHGLAGHMEHEEERALPLVGEHLTAREWAAFGRAAARMQGIRGAAEFLPWMLDGAPDATARQVMALLPRPVRLIYRLAWRRRYARVPRWLPAGATRS